ncbi:hypothetical protein JXJ21_18925 [candidate division KSB1 bacterium]|nr:hypothetical protein [candidate division KSB1 bacterium]
MQRWIFTIFLIAVCVLNPDAIRSQLATDEMQVREVFEKFERGINEQNPAVGTELAAKDCPKFIKFYNLTLMVHKRLNKPFAPEVERVQLLKDGRAKAKVILTQVKNLKVFTLKKEDGAWKISGMTDLHIPLYGAPRGSYSEILELDQKERGQQTLEMQIANWARMYHRLKKTSGEQAAQALFLDGEQFAYFMDSWLPFVDGAAQFAMFYAIQHHNLFSSDIKLPIATSAKAEIELKPMPELEIIRLADYEPKFTKAEFISLFAAIMTDRANRCGVKCEIQFESLADCVIKVTQ